jgi:hypothetical protein
MKSKISHFLSIYLLFLIPLSYAVPVSVRATYAAEPANQQPVEPTQVNNINVVNMSAVQQNEPASQQRAVVDAADVWASTSVETHHDKQFVSLPSPKHPVIAAAPQVEKPMVKKSTPYAPSGSYKVVSLSGNNRVGNGVANYAIASKPKTLSRRQILEREIYQEQEALNAALTRFIAAKKAKNETLAQQILMQITDRRLNLKALQAELRRY